MRIYVKNIPVTFVRFQTTSSLGHFCRNKKKKQQQQQQQQ